VKEEAMTRNEKYLAALVLAGVVSYIGSMKLAPKVRAAMIPAARPFIAKQIFYSMSSSDQEKDSEVANIGRREDSAEYLERLPFSSDLATKAFLARSITFPDGRQVMVADEIAARSTYQLPAADIQKRESSFSGSSSDCTMPGEVVDKKGQEYGFQVLHVSYILPDDPLTRDTGLRLPSFACFEIARTEDHRQTADAPWKTRLGMRTVSFVPIAPPESKFTGFNSYAEVKPGDMFKAFALKRGITAQACPQCYAGLPKEDTEYLRSQK
jgi:hypothetical protein